MRLPAFHLVGSFLLCREHTEIDCDRRAEFQCSRGQADAIRPDLNLNPTDHDRTDLPTVPPRPNRTQKVRLTLIPSSITAAHENFNASGITTQSTRFPFDRKPDDGGGDCQEPDTACWRPCLDGGASDLNP